MTSVRGLMLALKLFVVVLFLQAVSGRHRSRSHDGDRRQNGYLNCICGVQSLGGRVVNGKTAKRNEFPWVATIVQTGTRSPKCGASVINDRWILTAAHCLVLNDIEPKHIEILTHAHILDFALESFWADTPLGEAGSIRGAGYLLPNLTDKGDHSKRHKVAEIINHPKFANMDYDVALIRLKKRIKMNGKNSPTPICLPEPGQFTDDILRGLKATVIGWGYPHQHAGSTTRILQKLQLPFIPLKTCQEWTTQPLTQRMLCATYKKGGKDACGGDSGGPLLVKNSTTNRWTQVGIVSWGIGCAQESQPSIYTRLTELVYWVKKHAKSGRYCRED